MSAALIAVLGAVAAPLCALAGAVYGAKQSAKAQRAAAAEANEAAMAQVTQVSAVESAQKVLVETIGEMRAELQRQDQDHDRGLAELRERHEQALSRFRADLDQIKAHHGECERQRKVLALRVAELEAR